MSTETAMVGLPRDPGRPSGDLLDDREAPALRHQVWDAELPANGRLRTVATDDATADCQVGLGVEWMWVRISTGA